MTVSSNYVGANAQTVESAVTIPLEQQINGVQGMRYIESTSSNDGTSSPSPPPSKLATAWISPPSTCRTVSRLPPAACLRR